MYLNQNNFYCSLLSWHCLKQFSSINVVVTTNFLWSQNSVYVFIHSKTVELFSKFLILEPSISAWFNIPMEFWILFCRIYWDMATIRKKLVVVGDSACGKSCLLTVFSGHQFSELFENYTTNVQIEGKKVMVVLKVFSV